MDVEGEQLEIRLAHSVLVLGAQLVAGPAAALDHRLAKATAAFWTYSKFLKSREISFEEWAQECKKQVWSVALYSAPA